CAATGPSKCTTMSASGKTPAASAARTRPWPPSATRSSGSCTCTRYRTSPRSCHRDPCRLPLQLLGLTRPQVPLTGNHAVTRTRQSPAPRTAIPPHPPRQAPDDQHEHESATRPAKQMTDLAGTLGPFAPLTRRVGAAYGFDHL